MNTGTKLRNALAEIAFHLETIDELCQQITKLEHCNASSKSRLRKCREYLKKAYADGNHWLEQVRAGDEALRFTQEQHDKARARANLAEDVAEKLRLELKEAQQKHAFLFTEMVNLQTVRAALALALRIALRRIGVGCP